MLCVLCDTPLAVATERGLTDCAHEFCLKCICRQLTDFRNLCPICGSKVKTVHQLQPHAHDDGGDAAERAAIETPAPASIRFNNAVYILNVSIWAVDDPARKLAELFYLEQARLVHKGKLLKKGDVWPGTVVQLFGTRRGSHQGEDARGLVGMWKAYAPWNAVSTTMLKRARTIICCPFTVVYEFFRSMFVSGDHERRGYRRIDPSGADGTAPRQSSSFHAPGRVASPSLIESAE